jgi:hypothetical protein
LKDQLQTAAHVLWKVSSKLKIAAHKTKTIKFIRTHKTYKNTGTEILIT